MALSENGHILQKTLYNMTSDIHADNEHNPLEISGCSPRCCRPTLCSPVSNPFELRAFGPVGQRRNYFYSKNNFKAMGVLPAGAGQLSLDKLEMGLS